MGALLAIASAFTANKPALFRQPITSRHLLSDSETEQVLKSAEDCVAGECSVDEVSDLLNVLKDTEKDLESRLDKTMNMISHLQHINEQDERKVDEVRAFVRDLLRVFSTEKPSILAVGYSGEIGDGPKTAYDVLPPKKWKASA